jgi:hypothetical protein
MARRAIAPRRQARTTLLIVGEGYAEFGLLKHLRALYTGGNEGYSVTVKNARGKGAGHVVQYAIRQGEQFPFDHSGALLDTDEGWTEDVQALVRRKRLQVVASTPCLEAWLLAIRGRSGERDTSGHKREFQRSFGCAADHPRALEQLDRQVLDGARSRVATLDALLSMMGV